jgi:hypothetical protein
MALNGAYRFLYFFVMKKIPIKDVPSGLEEYVFDLEGVELGKYALQLAPPSNNIRSPEDVDSNKDAIEMQVTDGAEKTFQAVYPELNHKAHYSVDLSAIELQPLLQRIESIENQMSQLLSKQTSKLVRSKQELHTDSDFSTMEQQPLVQRIESVENQNSEMFRKIESTDSRFDGFEAKADSRFDGFEAKTDSRFDGFEAKADSRFDGFEAKLNVIMQALSQTPQ